MDEPKNPKDFARIMQMVKNGITPDDVKDIDDKPRDPDSMVESGRRSAPAKVIIIHPIYLISYISIPLNIWI